MDIRPVSIVRTHRTFLMVVSHYRPPIQDRTYDFTAFDDNQDERSAQAHGRTEILAIETLLEVMEERDLSTIAVIAS